MSGSYAGRIAPPGMPKTVSTPAASSERMSDCAPVISSRCGTDARARSAAAAAAWAGLGAGLGVVDAWSAAG